MVRATSLALPRVYARCLPEDALPRVASWPLGSACQAQARRTASRAEPRRSAGRCEPGTTMAVHSCRAWPMRLRAAVDIALRFAPATSRLDRGEARSPGQPATCNRRRGLPTGRRSCSPRSGRAGPAGPVRADRQGSSPRQGLQDQGRQHGRGGLMREVRRRFHEELHALEDEVQQTGRQAQLLLDGRCRPLRAATRRSVTR